MCHSSKMSNIQVTSNTQTNQASKICEASHGSKARFYFFLSFPRFMKLWLIQAKRDVEAFLFCIVLNVIHYKFNDLLSSTECICVSVSTPFSTCCRIRAEKSYRFSPHDIFPSRRAGCFWLFGPQIARNLQLSSTTGLK